MSTDQIEKTVVLRAPRSRVWRALTKAPEFGSWFGATFEGAAFAAGKAVKGKITIPGYGHVTLDMTIQTVEPEVSLSYRWHPYAVDPAVDYSTEPTTLVEFRLEDVAEGTRLTVVESGFDAIPAARRAEALRKNDQGWAGQLKNIERYLAQ